MSDLSQRNIHLNRLNSIFRYRIRKKGLRFWSDQSQKIYTSQRTHDVKPCVRKKIVITAVAPIKKGVTNTNYSSWTKAVHFSMSCVWNSNLYIAKVHTDLWFRNACRYLLVHIAIPALCLSKRRNQKILTFSFSNWKTLPLSFTCFGRQRNGIMVLDL